MKASDLLEKVYGHPSAVWFPREEGYTAPPDWTEPAGVFRELGKAGEVRDYLEVGSWLGHSVMRAANAFPDAECLACVDTWLGGAEHWIDRANPSHDLRVSQDGTPGLWECFKGNVAAWKLTERVAPLRMSSGVGAQVLAHHGFTADVVYVDAGHSYAEVLADCRGYWPLCRRWLVGDDWADPRFGVAQGVLDFMRLANVDPRRLQVLGGNFWVIEK